MTFPILSHSEPRSIVVMQLGLVGDSTLQETYLEDLKKSEPKEHSYKSIEC